MASGAAVREPGERRPPPLLAAPDDRPPRGRRAARPDGTGRPRGVAAGAPGRGRSRPTS